ncbi:MAG: protein kinase [Sandaracinaceae bacterium]
MSASPPITEKHVAGAAVRGLLSVGSHGAVFEVEDAGAPGELWRLGAETRTAELTRRLEVLASQPFEGLLPVRDVVMSDDPPHLTVGSGPWAWGAFDLWATDVGGVSAQLLRLLDALAHAHRWGIVHGALGAGAIGRGPDGLLSLDMTGLSVRDAVPVERAPELVRAQASAAADVWGLAALVSRTAQVATDDARLGDLLARMMVDDPEARPTAREVALELGDDGESTQVNAGTAPEEPAKLHGTFPSTLGAYRLIESIGKGGMGRVFRAEDLVGGREVALKVLLPNIASDPNLVARFRREARVLSQMQSPFVTRFVEANEDRGFHYLVMELAEGTSAKRLRVQRDGLDLELALDIVTDTARALSEVHDLGLVHRDVKPDNVLVALRPNARPGIKLCDFGIARPEQPAESDDLTQEGTPGTPSFMAPEQVTGEPLDARTDVYALGCTVFDLLAGRGPFTGAGPFILVGHVTKPPPALSELFPTVPPAIESVVMRCLEKKPDARYPDARALLDALEQARRGDIATPDALPQRLGVEGAPSTYEFKWTLGSTPEALWPHVSNTERLNRAAGLDDVSWSHHPDGDGYVKTEGRFRAAGMELRWRENPFEWVEPRRLGVVREYSSGPFEWLRSTVRLDPSASGGTELTHRVEVRPRNLLGRAAASVEIGVKLRRGLARVYQHIDDTCQAPGTTKDPFEDQEKTRGVRRRAEEKAHAVMAAGGDPAITQALVETIVHAPASTIARIRPRAWAHERSLSEDATLDTLLIAAHAGMLEVLWDLLCPMCRVPSGIESTLKALSEHGRCEVCALDFTLDMARSVELVFRAHPSVRPADTGVYCIGGPAHSPHVVAQVRLAPGERFALDLHLEEGRYTVAGRGLETDWSFSVDPRAPLDTWDLPLRRGAPSSQPRSLGTGGQLLLLTNDFPFEVVARVERATLRSDAVTAADAACNARFRALFPEQVLAPEQLVSISNTALLFASVPSALSRYEEDEAAVHRELLALSQRVEASAAVEGGALVKLHGDGVMAVFSDRVAAVRAAMNVVRGNSSVTVAAHAGPARMTTVGGRLDYFGHTIHLGEQMSRLAAPGELLLSEPLMADPALAPLVQASTRALGYLQVGRSIVGRLEVMPVVG